ncbi:MAG: ABC transporter permease [Verrucomicrobia bacterium]|nr:ABC transporter permease [Verrucomicrobiota bacterium]
MLWTTLFLLVPLVAIGVISLLSKGIYGWFSPPFTLYSYLRFLGFGLLGFDLLYPMVIVRSIVLGAATTLLCVLAAFPLAFFISGLPSRRKHLALTLVVIPLWTNMMIRTYAWQILLGPQSGLSRLLVAAGLWPAGAGLYPSTMAVYVGMVCDFLPFLVLPLYASVEKLDWIQVEAARDLGADALQTFRHAILPQVVPGLAAGCLLVFIPASGQFVIPDLLGGGKTVMVGNLIQQQFLQSRDWPFGAAIAFVAMALSMAGIWVYARAAGARADQVIL